MQQSIVELLIAPWKTALLHAAVRLDLFTVLAAGPLPVEEIAARVRVGDHQVKILLDALVALELLQLKEGRYGNSQFGEAYFVAGMPCYVGDFLRVMVEEAPRWARLPHDLGMENGLSAVPDEGEGVFTRGMHNLAMLGEADALAGAVDLSECVKLVDAGGGSGIYSVALCRKYPGLTCVVLERKQPAAAAAELIACHGERHRVALRVLDIEKEKWDQRADAILLSDVIYEEDNARKILQNARECLRDGGQLIVRGYYADPDGPPALFDTLFAVNQLVFNPKGRILDFPSLQALIRAMGFTITKAAPLTERSRIVIANLDGPFISSPERE